MFIYKTVLQHSTYPQIVVSGNPQEEQPVAKEQEVVNMSVFTSAAASARDKKQCESTQKNYLSKIAKVAKFLYDSHDPHDLSQDLRQYTTRYEIGQHLPAGPTAKIKGKPAFNLPYLLLFLTF